MARKLILAVDDDASICEFYSEGLPALGYDAACATSAQKAREWLKKDKPDLILMDIMMPGEDGIALTREIRRTLDIPVIVVSGLADAATLNDALISGAADYIVKPIELDTLKAKIERVFQVVERRRSQAKGES